MKSELELNLRSKSSSVHIISRNVFWTHVTLCIISMPRPNGNIDVFRFLALALSLLFLSNSTDRLVKGKQKLSVATCCYSL